jgi:uncharacterized membrane protein
MLLSLPDFIGRFHPVLVHLPIGILLLACFFQLLTSKEKFAFLQPAVPLMFFWGMLGAILSSVSGYMLSLSGDYEAQLVGWHQWLGISTAIVSLMLWVLYKFSIAVKTARFVSVLIIVLITVTGHLGGSLTHGEDYLTKGLQSGSESAAIKPIPNIQEAVVYTDVVQPLLEAKCYSCHGSSKQKGKLRLDQQEFILKGGKNGNTLEPGNADESEMIKRMLLPLDNEDHMPPKEKPQLTALEISLLQWWVNSGAHFNKKVKELPQTEKIKPALLSLQAGSADKEQRMTDVPEEPVVKADESIIGRLKKAGVLVIPVAQNSNYLSVNFVTATSSVDSLVPLLQSLNKQIVWLKLDQASLKDASMDVIAKLTTLTRLQLSNTDITDKGLLKLRSLEKLQSLNLTGTKITAAGVVQLKGLKQLTHLYLYQTGVSTADWNLLRQSFPAAQLDSGRYSVPILASDTTKITAPQN